jgi:ribosomal protein S18 acetylase RimI-like enzyme
MIRALEVGDAEQCDAVIRSLPDWFGNDQGIAEAAAAVRTQAGLVSVLDGAVIGFLTWKRHHPTTAEITWLAVHADYRGGGTGTGLVEELVASAGALRYLTVKTLSASSDYPPYEETRAFYRARGFTELIELDIWGPDNPATLFVRPL